MNKNTAFYKSLKVMHKFALLTMALLFFFFISPASGLSAETINFTIIHNSNVQGHLFPCPT
jgi:hypothetical protein